MNSINLIGNLTTAVELKQIGDDKQVASFGLAVDRPGKDAGADFFRVETWNGNAAACAQYLAKGALVGVEGAIRTSVVEKDGAKNYYWKVNANRVKFLTPRSDTAPAGTETTAPEPTAEDDIPF